MHSATTLGRVGAGGSVFDKDGVLFVFLENRYPSEHTWREQAQPANQAARRPGMQGRGRQGERELEEESREKHEKQRAEGRAR